MKVDIWSSVKFCNYRGSPLNDRCCSPTTRRTTKHHSPDFGPSPLSSKSGCYWLPKGEEAPQQFHDLRWLRTAHAVEEKGWYQGWIHLEAIFMWYAPVHPLWPILFQVKAGALLVPQFNLPLGHWPARTYYCKSAKPLTARGVLSETVWYGHKTWWTWVCGGDRWVAIKRKMQDKQIGPSVLCW